MMHLRFYASELGRALQDVPHAQEENCPEMARAAMALLSGSRLAQILSYAPLRHFHTVTALSPLARLFAELHIRPTNNARAVGQVYIDEKHLCYRIHIDGERGGDLDKLRVCLWWAEGCGLPLMLDVDSDAVGLFTLLPPLMRQRVVKLHLHISTVLSFHHDRVDTTGTRQTDALSLSRETDHHSSPLASLPVHAAAEEDTPATPFLGFLASLSSLQQLCLDTKGYVYKGKRTSSPLLQALRVAAGLPIRHLRLSRCRVTKHPILDPPPPLLRRLEVLSCELRSIGSLRECQELEEVEFNFCDRLPHLTELASAPRLRTVTAFLCGLKSTAALRSCAALTELNVSHNPTLHSLSELGGTLAQDQVQLQQLRSLTAIKCGLSAIDGLHRCPELTTVDLSYNLYLQSLSGLAGAPSLTVLHAVKCGLRSLDGLCCCPLLTELNVTNNRLLTSLAGLARSPSLERLIATECDLADLDGLSSCPRLTTVEVSRNYHLRSLSALANTRRLRSVKATLCALTELGVLSSCPSLAVVDVSFNPALVSVEGLAGAPQLREVDVHDCGVTDIGVLRSCPALRRVTVTHCPCAQDAEALKNVHVVTR